MSLPKGYDYKPIPKPFYLGKSDIEGYGIFTDRDIEEDEIFFDSETHTKLSTGELLRSPLGGFINSADTPNATLWGDQPDKAGNVQRYLLVTRSIKAGEEITLRYSDEICGLGLESCGE